MTIGGGVGVRLPRGGSVLTITRATLRSDGNRIWVSPDGGTEKSAPLGTAGDPREITQA